jgi:anthranilate phosphoribosyltransferase
MASALHELGVRGAWVVHSSDGLDEISPFAPTRVSVVSRSGVTERSLTPEDFGATRSPEGAIDGGDPEHNAAIIREVVARRPHPARDAFLLNAAACLCVSKGLEPRAAYQAAAHAVDSGAASAKLESWAAATQSAAG